MSNIPFSPGPPSPLRSPTPSPSKLRRSSLDPGSVQKQCVNRNVEWLSSPGAWTFVISLIGLTWLVFCVFMDPGMAWTYTHLTHAAVTYYLLHWNKGSPIEMDQGTYDKLTYWEQLDDGVQYTPNRKFLVVLPFLLFILATHGSDYRRQPLGLNLAALVILIVAKLPQLDQVRFFGINEW